MTKMTCRILPFEFPAFDVAPRAVVKPPALSVGTTIVRPQAASARPSAAAAILVVTDHIPARRRRRVRLKTDPIGGGSGACDLRELARRLGVVERRRILRRIVRARVGGRELRQTEVILD